MSHKKNIVGAQVSSLRPYLQTPQELRASLQKLADMGYRTVQMQWWNPEFEPELVAAAVWDAGLTCVSTQDLYTAVRDDFERTVRLNVLCGSTCGMWRSSPTRRATRPSAMRIPYICGTRWPRCSSRTWTKPVQCASTH